MEDGIERRRQTRPGQALRVVIGHAETVIYAIVAVLLGVAAGFTLVGTVRDVIEGAHARAITDTGVFLLDRVLLMFIFAELLYTLRLVSLRGRVLVEPFLFIGLIAVVRRILVVTAESELRPGRVTDFLAEIGALAGLVLVLALSIHLLRRSASNQP
ncbi:MAG: hypothetical protein JWQ48_636 [Conexibacter sp.]|nr:hypothetical protein [Conexibacter sp.]